MTAWANWSGDVRAHPAARLRPRNRAELVAIVQRAHRAAPPAPVRAVGSGWSFSAVAATEGYLVDIGRLSATLSGVVPPGDHLHVEAGITLWQLYRRLDRAGRAVAAMPGASGQTIAGATATASHGAELHLPPLADAIAAVHLVAAGGVEHWIEGDHPVADHTTIAARYPRIRIHHDETLLRAVQVGLGRFGIIYALALRTVPRFVVRERRRAMPWPDGRRLLQHQSEDADHRALQIVISPHPHRDGRTCWLTARSEVPATAHQTAPPRSYRASRAAAAMIGSGITGTWRPSDVVSALCRTANAHHRPNWTTAFTRRVLAAAQRPVDRHRVGYQAATGPAWSLEWCRGHSTELFFDAANTAYLDWIDEVLLPAVDAAAAAGTAVAGWISLRYTAATAALLGMQQWPRTVAIEISLLRGIPGTLDLLTRLERHAIGHGAIPHWGQLNTLTEQEAARSYPHLPHWHRQLRAIDPDGLFNNAFCRDRGL